MTNPTPISDDELAAMEQRCEAATRSAEMMDACEIDSIEIFRDEGDTDLSLEYGKWVTDVLNAIDDMPRLIRDLRAAHAEVERLQSELACVIQDRDARRERKTLCEELEAENARLRERIAALEGKPT